MDFTGIFKRFCIGLGAYLIGGWSKLLEIMVIFIVVDYASGYLKGIYKKEISSKIGYRGLVKKSSYMLAVIIGASLDRLIYTSSFNIPITIFNIPVSFRDLIILSIIGNEGISIVENLGEMNILIPEPIKKFFKQLKQNNDKKLD